jgi:hypothetical protein
VLRTLPVELTEAQAKQALDPMLNQVGQIADPYALLSGAADAGGQTT